MQVGGQTVDYGYVGDIFGIDSSILLKLLDNDLVPIVSPLSADDEDLQIAVLDLDEIDRRIATLPLRGVKGTTGTQASFLELFKGDHAKVRELDRRVVRAMGFESSIPVSGQTYTRKLDAMVLAAVGGLAASAAKFASDLRMLQAWGEIEEPFEKEQIGSSAMAYKRNPMRSERINSLARFVLSLEPNGNQTHSVQYFERTLDDSANRRIVIPDASHHRTVQSSNKSPVPTTTPALLCSGILKVRCQWDVWLKRPTNSTRDWMWRPFSTSSSSARYWLASVASAMSLSELTRAETVTTPGGTVAFAAGLISGLSGSVVSMLAYVQEVGTFGLTGRS